MAEPQRMVKPFRPVHQAGEGGGFDEYLRAMHAPIWPTYCIQKLTWLSHDSVIWSYMMKKLDMSRFTAVHAIASMKAMSWLGASVAARCNTCGARRGKREVQHLWREKRQTGGATPVAREEANGRGKGARKQSIKAVRRQRARVWPRGATPAGGAAQEWASAGGLREGGKQSIKAMPWRVQQVAA
eukprot:352308-Chlamydomonas_euryale.AAC.2